MQSPVHSYSNTGTYTVSLILQNPCVNDTLIQTVNVTTIGPSPLVEGDFSLCKGEKRTYTATGGNAFLWSNGLNTNTVSLNPPQTSVYTLSATTNGCTLSKSFTVTVNPCLGIAERITAGIFRLYPNPFSEDIIIESPADTKAVISDLSGRQLRVIMLKSGGNLVNIGEFGTGVYMIQYELNGQSLRDRIVKVEE